MPHLRLQHVLYILEAKSPSPDRAALPPRGRKLGSCHIHGGARFGASPLRRATRVECTGWTAPGGIHRMAPSQDRASPSPLAGPAARRATIASWAKHTQVRLLRLEDPPCELAVLIFSPRDAGADPACAQPPQCTPRRKPRPSSQVPRPKSQAPSPAGVAPRRAAATGQGRASVPRRFSPCYGDERRARPCALRGHGCRCARRRSGHIRARGCGLRLCGRAVLRSRRYR
jgi:hypothetical protein